MFLLSRIVGIGHRRRFRTGAVLIAAALTLSVATTAVAADTRPYPRTYQAQSGWTDPNVLGRYDMVVGYASWDLAKVKAVNPGGLFFLQPGLNPTSSDYQAVHITTGAIDRFGGKTDTLPGGANLGTIRPFNTTWDYLYNANGSRAGSYPTWNFGGPGANGTSTFIAKVIAYAAKLSGLYSKGWHGIHTDQWNYSFVWTYGTNLDADRNRVVDNLTATRTAWQNGMSNAGKLLGTYLSGKSVGGNGAWWRPDLWSGTDPQGWRSSSNYTLIEHFEKHFYNNPDAAISVANAWLGFADPLGRNRYMATMQNALRCDGTLLQLPSGTNPNQNVYMLDPCVMKSMRWGLTLALMTGLYYEILVSKMHGTRWWYDEFDGGVGVRRRGYLGQPLGAPVKLPNGVYRRNFTNGVALNNSTSVTQTVSLGGTFRKLQGTQNPSLNNGAAVTSVTIPPHDGLILLRTGQPSAQPSNGDEIPPAVPEGPAAGDVYDGLVSDPGCGACVVALVGGELRTTIAGGADNLDTAYGWHDAGEQQGRVYTRHILRLANGQTLGGDLIVHQLLDSANRIVYQLSLNAARQLVLYSPAGGLRTTAISVPFNVTIPNDGTPTRIEVSALRNDSITVRANGTGIYALTALSGATGTNPRYLRIGIIRYGTASTAEPVTVHHSGVDVTGSGWLGAP